MHDSKWDQSTPTAGHLVTSAHVAHAFIPDPMENKNLMFLRKKNMSESDDEPELDQEDKDSFPLGNFYEEDLPTKEKHAYLRLMKRLPLEGGSGDSLKFHCLPFFVIFSAKKLYAECGFCDFDTELLIVNYDLVYYRICTILQKWMLRHGYLEEEAGGDEKEDNELYVDIPAILSFGIDTLDDEEDFFSEIRVWINAWCRDDCWEFYRHHLRPLVEKHMESNVANLCIDYTN